LGISAEYNPIIEAIRNLPKPVVAAVNGAKQNIESRLEATETAANPKQRASELANVVRFANATGWRTASEVGGSWKRG
jgi:hypothetical protein